MLSGEEGKGGDHWGMRALGIAVFSALLITKWEASPEVEVHLEGSAR
jgi:hypothetical protein